MLLALPLPGFASGLCRLEAEHEAAVERYLAQYIGLQQAA